MEPKGGNHGPQTDGRACARGGAAAVHSAFAQDKRVVTWNADYDPIPLAAAEALIADFEAANPEIDVQLTNFDHEAYKNAIRNFLTAIRRIWPTGMPRTGCVPSSRRACSPISRTSGPNNGLMDSLASSVLSSTIDGKQYAIPYTYYQWGIYYNRDAYAAAGVEPRAPKA
jgi:multiple sugar transport system substrate-binding protein